MYLFIFILILFVGTYIALRSPWVKNKIGLEAISRVNEAFGTEIEADNVYIDWENNIVIQNVRATDEYKNQFIKIAKLTADINILDFIEYLYSTDWKFKELEFDKITADSAQIEIITYKGDSTSNLGQFINKFKNDKPPSEDKFTFKSKIEFNNSSVLVINENKDPSEQISATNTHFLVNDLKTYGSDVDAYLKEFSGIVKRKNSTLDVKNLHTQFSLRPDSLTLKDLGIQSNSSNLIADLQLKYDSLGSFQNFEYAVDWVGDIKEGSYVDGHFINFLTPVWDTEVRYNITSEVSGTLSNLLLTDLRINSGDLKLNSDKLRLLQITDGELFTIDSKNLHIIGNENAVVKVLPDKYGSKVKGKINQLGNVDYQGDLVLNRNKIETTGTFISQLGNVKLEDVVLHNYSNENIDYKGHIVSKNLNLSPLMKGNTLGNIDTDMLVEGKGLDPKTLEAQMVGDIYSIQVDKYNLSNLNVDAIYKNEEIMGSLISKDPKADLQTQGTLAFAPNHLIADLEGSINHLDLYALGFVQEPTTIKGQFDVDVKGNSVDDIIGDINLKYIEYVSTEKAMPFESIAINTYIENNDRVLNILSPSNINGTLKGRFNLQDIPTMFVNGLSNLVVGLKPKNNLKNKFLFIDLDIQDNVIDLIFPDLSLESGTRLTGHYDGGSNDMKLLVNTPKLNYKNITVDSLFIDINTDNPSQQFHVNLESLYFNEFVVKKLKSSGFMRNDTLMVASDFNMNSLNNEKVVLNAYQTKTENELVVGVQNSSITINDVLWKINAENKKDHALLTYNQDTKVWYANNFTISSKMSKIDAYGYFKDNEDFEFDAQVNNVLLEDIVPTNKLGEFELKGLINANAKIKQKGKTFQPIVNVNIQDLFFNNYELGEFKSDISLNPENSNKFDILAFLDKDENKYLTIKGNIENQKNKSPLLDVNLDFNQFEMNILNQFLSSIITDMRGTVTGNVTMDGELRNPGYNGMLTTNDVGMTIEFLQTDYQFDDDSDIILDGNFTNGAINFFDIPFIDTKFGTRGNLVGSLLNSEFKVWGLNLEFQSDDPENGLLVLNTTEEDNDLFYGRVFAQGDFYLSGSTDGVISVTSNAEVLDTSKFTLNNATTFTVENNSILRFTEDPNAETETEEVPKKNTGVALNFGIVVQDGAEITVLLDQFTNSTIVVKGYTTNDNGIKFKMNPAGEIEMEGSYSVSSGKYLFKLGPIRKEFNISDDSKIEWIGDPYNANLYIHTYNRVFVNNIGEYLNTQNQPSTEVDIGIDLTGSLSNIDLKPNITAPKSSTEIQNLLQNKFFNNPDEEYIQFFSLVASKSFNTASNNFAENTVTSNAYDLVLSQFFNMFNSINSNIQLNASYTPEDNNNNTSSSIQGNIQFRLNNRWSIRSTLGIPINTSSADNQSIWTQEVEMEYDVSKDNDGSVVLEAFSRPTTFGIKNFTNNSNTYQSYGLGVIFKWDFNEFNEIIKNKKDRKRDSIKINKGTDSLSIMKVQIDSIMRANQLID